MGFRQLKRCGPFIYWKNVQYKHCLIRNREDYWDFYSSGSKNTFQLLLIKE